MLAEIFKALVFTSLIGTALTAVLMLVRPITKRHFSSGWHYYIWLVVLIVMVLPVRFDLPEGGQFSKNAEEVSKDFETISVVDKSTYKVVCKYIDATEIGSQTKLKSVDIAIEYLKNFIISKMNMFSLAWMIVAILLILMKISAYIMFRCRIMRHSESFLCPELEYFTKRKVIVRKSSETNSPIMMGILWPVLVLPDVDLTAEQLWNILAHEMTHFRRNDILYKWFVAFVKCIHWFNPMIYFVNRQINIWCEVSCDLAVVEQMNKEEECSYINTILALISAAGKSKNIPLTTGMLGSKETLKRRFIMIKNKTSVSKKAKIASGVIAAAVLVSTLGISGVAAKDVLEDNETIAETTVAEEEVKQEAEEVVVPEIIEPASVMDVNNTQKQPDADEHTEDSYTNVEATEVSEAVESEKLEIVWPCPSSDKITVAFNTRVNPVTGEKIEHNGIDIYAQTGEEVVAAIAGEVTESGWNRDKGYCVVIANGNVEIMYAHLSEINVVVGDIVVAGQSVAEVGNTGMSTGPHLHFEIKVDGAYVDPQLYGY